NPLPQAVYNSNRLSGQFLTWISSPEECGSGCIVTDDLRIDGGDILSVPKVTMGGSTVKLPGGMPANWNVGPVTPYMTPSKWWSVPAAAMPKRMYEFDAASAELGSVPA